MFLLGAVITLFSMSVSVSLGVLVPLSERGFIRRENVIPYIMGANVTTFIDTFFVALLLDNPEALNLVWIQMLSIALVSAVILVGFFRYYETAMLRLTEWVTKTNRNMVLFVALIILVPLLLLVP
jgi:Na+/phosphate symporter